MSDFVHFCFIFFNLNETPSDLWTTAAFFTNNIKIKPFVVKCAFRCFLWDHFLSLTFHFPTNIKLLVFQFTHCKSELLHNAFWVDLCSTRSQLVLTPCGRWSCEIEAAAALELFKADLQTDRCVWSFNTSFFYRKEEKRPRRKHTHHAVWALKSSHLSAISCETSLNLYKLQSDSNRQSRTLNCITFIIIIIWFKYI